MNKFFVEPGNVNLDTNKIIIDSSIDTKHIVKVLRMSEGEEVLVSNGLGQDYLCEIVKLDRDAVLCTIIKSDLKSNEAPLEITLFQCLPKGSKMEMLLQKNVEVGVSSFIPVASKRCVSKLEDKKKTKNKVDRWNKIVKEAAMQSKRSMIPKVKNPINFSDIEKFSSLMDILIVPYEDESITYISDLDIPRDKASKVGIIIGPEGGFDPSEIDVLKTIGAKIITLGPRILRTETAGIVASSLVLYEFGDMGRTI